MKELLDFIRDYNGSLSYDEEHGHFILLKGPSDENTPHCSLEGCDDAGIIPDDVGAIWVTPAILSLERFGL